MKVGRRAFIKFMGSALAAAGMESVTKLIHTNEYFVDERLGFGFRIPKNWNLKSFISFDQYRDKQILSEKYRDDKELLDDLTEDIVATISKYPIDDGENVFSPSITFFMADKDEELIKKFGDLKTIMKLSLKGSKELLTNFECFEKPELIKMEGFEMVRSKSRFLFEHEGMSSTMIDHEMLVVVYKEQQYSINLYDSPYTGDSAQDELTLFKDSLHLA